MKHISYRQRVLAICSLLVIATSVDRLAEFQKIQYKVVNISDISNGSRTLQHLSFQTEPSEVDHVSSKQKLNPCMGKEKLVEVLQHAGISRRDAEGHCDKLPQWRFLTRLYGERPVILGLDTCQSYRTRRTSLFRLIVCETERCGWTEATTQAPLSNYRGRIFDIHEV